MGKVTVQPLTATIAATNDQRADLLPAVTVVTVQPLAATIENTPQSVVMDPVR
jgi:hypothetical protein